MLTRTDELKDRIEARKHALLAKYNDAKADTASAASNMKDKLKAKLDDLEEALEDGWDDMTDAIKTRLNHWLDQDN